ncbi:GDP-mannose 4,6-dehydratase [Mesorhizobium sp. M7A.F.Ca.US.006.01.1.1]|uniref:GDP-mannose 4,6-dehydratase n=1 Tax=Mesorhizobium sp. M7A.F.Ca.US.006.01.1.1 TaxID=2496707 RepID=UPI000FCAC5F4|nr:GDP-mannose 4,6-dehydratase [Mesorhizobium sp. M7A.F.Ca.US.006.01.1.1]RUZ78653.1 GDP-mannose 4,6-dehydratase [Mesorhizobium sp. M7A.F.Ca.US.006.01.1.1]
MANKTALITGITGQDGAYLSKLLLDKGYRVVGSMRRTSGIGTWRLQDLQVLRDIEFVSMELTEDSNVRAVLENVQPDEIYNLAAQSFVGDSFRQPIYTSQVTAIGTLRLLEGVRSVVPEAKFYQASTSEMFGKVQEVPQNERTPFYPRSPYGVAKLFAHWTVVNYREAYGLHCCSGILFNHESPLRGVEFLPRKVTLGMAKYALRGEGPLRVGNLEAKRDWGHARDYVDAMWRMLQTTPVMDFVVATGRTHTVREFVEMAAKACGIFLDWQGTGHNEQGIDRTTGKVVVSVDPAFYRPLEVDLLVGDSSRAKEVLGWSPTVRLEDLVAEMVEADMQRVSSNHAAGF